MRLLDPTPFLLEREAEARRLDAALPSERFTRRVRETLYKFALIRNSWGTTNIDAGPIELARVAELYDAHRAGAVRPGRVLPSELEVLRYFELLDDLPRERFAISLHDLRGLHREYFEGGVPLENHAKAGQFKHIDNVIVGPWGVFKTTPKEKVVEELQALLDWVNGPGLDVPTLLRAALFFHDFQRIHPFADGNGRTGRLATLWVLVIGGLPNIRLCPIDDAITDDREHYYEFLDRADHGDLEPWAHYFASTIVDGYKRSLVLAERLQRIPPALEEGGQQLLEWAYIHKVATFRPRDAALFFRGASRATVLRRLKELEELRLVKGTGRGEGRRYEVATLHEVRQAEV